MTFDIYYGAKPEKACDCIHEESENGICNECGEEVDWVSRTFKEVEKE